MVGIISYGAYVPKYRIKTEEIARVWNKNTEEVVRGLGVTQKSVPAQDEDSVTLALEASQQALLAAHKDPKVIEVLLVGSESHPYAVNPTSTIVGELLGVGNQYLAADLEFACKAGSAGMQLISGMIASGQAQYGLAVGTDAAQSKPHDMLEYTAGAGSAAFILGKSKKEIIAEICDFTSFSSDTPDFWRRDGMKYPSHGGRFTGEPAYFRHVLGAAESLFKKTNMKPADFDYAVLHMPNGKFPLLAAKRLGFSEKQIAPSLIVSEIGNPYSAASLMGLAAVLDQAKPKQKICMISYGSGAGSDAFVFETTDVLATYKKQGIAKMLAQSEYIDYPEYLKRMKVI